MRILVNGQDVPTKNLDTARIRDVADLQTQTGWKLSDIRTITSKNDSYTSAVITFLSLNAAGVRTSWEEVLDMPYEAVRVVREPGDNRGAEQTTPDPQSPSGASAPDADPEAEADPTEE